VQRDESSHAGVVERGPAEGKARGLERSERVPLRRGKRRFGLNADGQPEGRTHRQRAFDGFQFLRHGGERRGFILSLKLDERAAQKQPRDQGEAKFLHAPEGASGW
jgi:hypothetical protein